MVVKGEGQGAEALDCRCFSNFLSFLFFLCSASRDRNGLLRPTTLIRCAKFMNLRKKKTYSYESFKKPTISVTPLCNISVFGLSYCSIADTSPD